MKKLKYFMVGISAIFVLAIPVLNNRDNNLEASDVPLTAPTFSQYGKVQLGSLEFTVVSQNNGLQLLSDTTTSDSALFKDAKTSLNNIDGFGALGEAAIGQYAALPTTADFDTAKAESGDFLNSRIPTVSSKWWLGDTDLVDSKKARFVGGDNNLKEVVEVPKAGYGGTIPPKNGILPTCVVEKEEVFGEVFIDKKVDESIGGPDDERYYRFHQGLDFSSAPEYRRNPHLLLYTDNACQASLASPMSKEHNFGFNYEMRNGDKTLVEKYNISQDSNAFLSNYYESIAMKLATDAGLSTALPGKNGTLKFTLVLKANECTDISEVEMGTPDPIYNTTKYNSVKLNPMNHKVDLITNFQTFQSASFPPCDGQTHEPSSLAVRPYVSIPQDAIVLGTTEKRKYTPNSKMGTPLVSESNAKYLTLKNSGLNASLTNSSPIERGANDIITVPVTISANKEGTSYVSASATDKDGNAVYGVLGSITGTSGNVQLDVSNLVKDDASSVDIILYQEESGIGGTSYRSTGTPVTINFKEAQKIVFDADQTSTVIYGDEITITSSLTSALADQADTDILYSITSGNGEIVSQNYVKETGKATATIKGNTGTGTFTVAIDKARDETIGNAPRKTMDITLTKKEITVFPTKQTKRYVLGNTMPTLTSTSLGLVGEDTIPDTLVLNLSPLDGTSAAKPASDTTIDAIGKWKLLYDENALTSLPTEFSDKYTEFSNKYTVTLEDYDDDKDTHYFETFSDELPEAWYSITAANAHGWNNGDVVIAPTQEAIDEGFTIVNLYNAVGTELKTGPTITYKLQTDSEIPIITLVNETEESKKKTLRTVKIDTAKPSINATVDKADTWVSGSKKVTITATDTSSGMDTVVVKRGATSYTVTLEADKTYTFSADENDTYVIEGTDKAGNKETHNVRVQMIDKTALALTATLQEFASADHRTRDIILNKTVGNAGMKSYKAYYKATSTGAYEELENLDRATNPLTYTVKMNGFYKFELIDNTDAKVEKEVEVSGLNPPIPSTKITAKLKDGLNTVYVNDTWTKHDVVLTLENVNTEITEAVTWQVQVDGGAWTAVTGNTYEVTESAWLNKRYTFKATSTLKVEEPKGTGIRVKIDKEKPALPTIIDEDTYTSTAFFAADVTVKAATTDKNSKLEQVVHYKNGESGTWQEMIGNSTIMKTNGKHQLYFKVIDAAGNESEVKGPVHVNVDKTTPTISFTLNNDPIEELLNTLTLGYFFKETVKVDIQVDQEADVYYIVDDSPTPTAPTSDADWIEGNSVNIAPDKKAIVYAKAVNKANAETIDSTVYYVYADATSPNITFDTDLNWSNKKTMEVLINDGLSGIDTTTLTYTSSDKANEALTSSNGKAVINLVDGEYDVTVKASDNSGNKQSKSTRVKVDSVNPILDNVKADTSEWAASRTVRFDARDALSGLASTHPKITNSKGSVNAIKASNGKYYFTATENDTYTIEVMDQAGNKVSTTYVENKIGTDQSAIRVIAQSDNANISSNTWVKKDVIFTISDGSLTNPITGYEVAITSGIQPQESDWNTLSDPTNNKHLVSSEQRGKSYFFRSLPDKVTSTAFVVNIDKTAPTNVAITLRKKNSGPMARMFNLMSFGNWLKEEQTVSLSAMDNLSSASELKMYYAEEKNGVMGQWTADPKNLSYRDVDIKLHAKAVDLAGNESVASEIVQIDLLPPTILGVKDQSVYKHYYLPRFISVSDEGSGVKSASYTKDKGVSIPINAEVEITGVGEYLVEAEDNAGNTISITFKIIPLPDLEDIDGSDESKKIIDQIQKELDEIKEKIDETEAKEYEEWLENANDKWDSLRKTIIENDDKTSKVEGVGDTNFDPNVELIVDPIEESTLPKLPRKALYSYDVYLRKGTIVIQPNGDVKVYLPYPDKEAPIVYEIDENGKVREIPAQKEGDSVVFVTRDLKKYAISNIEQELEEIKVPGPDGDLDTDDDVIANPNDKGELPVKNPDGSVTLPSGGSVTYPNDKVIQTPDGGKLLPDGTLILPDGSEYDPEGNLKPKPNPDPELKPDPEVDKDLNIDSDGDGKPDVNVDVDCDGKADINIDTDDDGIPNINIDTTGDGKPNYNVDLDGDKEADLNIGFIKWKTDKCVNKGCVLYCTSSFYKPYLNIDTDGDMRPDVSIDFNKDKEPDLNVDIDGDYIPDLDIDSDGDGEPDINLDDDNDGWPDRNLALIKNWKPGLNVDSPMKYDTMGEIVVDKTLTPDTWQPSGGGSLGDANNGNGSTTPGTNKPQQGVGGSVTGDSVSRLLLWVMLIISGVTTYITHRLRKHLKEKT